MREFSKEAREEIVRAHIKEHGRFEAGEFLAAVRRSNGTHPAWAWFEWNDGKAAEDHRTWQARMFVQGLRIKFEVHDARSRSANVVVHELPAYVSPVADRQKGGGYFQTDPNDPLQRAEMLSQAARSLANFEERYAGLLALAGLSIQPVTKLRAALEQASQKKGEAA